jgi:hypothetical protein
MIRPKPQDLLALIINHLRTIVGLMKIPSLVGPLGAAKSGACLMQGLVWTFTSSISPPASSGTAQAQQCLWSLLSYNQLRQAALWPDAVPKTIVLGLEVLGRVTHSRIIGSQVRLTPPIYVALLGTRPQPILCWMRQWSTHGKRKDLIRCDLYSLLGNWFDFFPHFLPRKLTRRWPGDHIPTAGTRPC